MIICAVALRLSNPGATRSRIATTGDAMPAPAMRCPNLTEIDWSVDNPGYLLMPRLSFILLESLKPPSSNVLPRRGLSKNLYNYAKFLNKDKRSQAISISS